MENERLKRKGNFKIDESFEQILKDMNSSLEPLETKLVQELEVNEDSLPPLLFICYAPRTGSTLFAQSLALSQEFSYISNYNARFWKSPYLSMLLEKKIQMRENSLKQDIELKSNYGVTENIAFPHEFGFFWNQILTNNVNHRVDKEQLEASRLDFIKKQINAFRSLSNKPFFFKNGIAGYNAGIMRYLFPKAWFIVLERDETYVIQSIYKARQKLYGDTTSWWSLKPHNFEEIKKQSRNEIAEIKGQVDQIYKDIEMDLKGCKRVLNIKYSDFCKKPKEIFRTLLNAIEHSPSKEFESLKLPEIYESRSISVESKVFELITDIVNK